MIYDIQKVLQGILNMEEQIESLKARLAALEAAAKEQPDEQPHLEGGE